MEISHSVSIPLNLDSTTTNANPTTQVFKLSRPSLTTYPTTTLTPHQKSSSSSSFLAQLKQVFLPLKSTTTTSPPTGVSKEYRAIAPIDIPFDHHPNLSPSRRLDLHYARRGSANSDSTVDSTGSESFFGYGCHLHHRGSLHSRSIFTSLDSATSSVTSLPAIRVDGPMEKILRNLLPKVLYLQLNLVMGHPIYFTGDNESTITMPWPSFDPAFCSEVQYDPSRVIDTQVRNNPTVYTTEARSATLNGVIHLLACQGTTDSTFFNAFLRTYHYFTSGHDLLRVILARYINCHLFSLQTSSPVNKREWVEVIKYKLINLLKKWIYSYQSIIVKNVDLYEFVTAILKFVENLDPKHSSFIDSILKDLNSHLQAKNPMGVYHFDHHSSNTITNQIKMPNFDEEPSLFPQNFIDIDYKLLATQLSLLEHDQFTAIKPEELYHQAWNNRQNRRRTSPNLYSLIQTFNRVSEFIRTEICQPQPIKRQRKVISHSIKLAKYLVKIRNYNSGYGVFIGASLGLSSQKGQSSKSLSRSDRRDFQALESLFSPTHNYKAYRSSIEKARSLSGPLFPFVGRTLSDLVFTEDGNPTYLHPNLTTHPSLSPSRAIPHLNLHKLTMISKHMTDLLECQDRPFQFDTDIHVQGWIQSHIFEPTTLSPPRSP